MIRSPLRLPFLPWWRSNSRTRCPLTGCLTSLKNKAEGFSCHTAPELVGVFTCRCPGNGVVEMAKILKSKGADTVHFCTCAFSRKEGRQWVLGNGFCDHLEALMDRVVNETGMTCVKGSAHLPDGYHAQVLHPQSV